MQAVSRFHANVFFNGSCVDMQKTSSRKQFKHVLYFLRVRSMALKHLMFHLIVEDGANLKHPLLHGSVIPSVPNLLIVKKPVELKLDDTRESVFKVNPMGFSHQVLLIGLTVLRCCMEIHCM